MQKARERGTPNMNNELSYYYTEPDKEIQFVYIPKREFYYSFYNTETNTTTITHHDPSVPHYHIKHQGRLSDSAIFVAIRSYESGVRAAMEAQKEWDSDDIQHVDFYGTELTYDKRDGYVFCGDSLEAEARSKMSREELIEFLIDFNRAEKRWSTEKWLEEMKGS